MAIETSAMASVVSNACGTSDGITGVPSPTRCMSATHLSPMAAPIPTTASVVIAPMSRALPDARLRVESSLMAVASERPGKSVTSPANDTTRSDGSIPINIIQRTTIAARIVDTHAPPNSPSNSRSRRRDANLSNTPSANPTGSAASISSPSPPRKRAAPAENKAYAIHSVSALGLCNDSLTPRNAAVPPGASNSPQATRSATR